MLCIIMNYITQQYCIFILKSKLLSTNKNCRRPAEAWQCAIGATDASWPDGRLNSDGTGAIGATELMLRRNCDRC